MKIDVSALIKGEKGAAYAHEYDAWMCFFRLLGYSTTVIECSGVPSCWTPFIKFLGHEVESVERCKLPGWEFESLDWPTFYASASDQRRAVEIASTCRPELVHALYCADTEWPCPLRIEYEHEDFPVTCNGSFFRREVLDFRKRLEGYEPPSKRAVVTPCSAEKPYPSTLHQAVLDRLPEGWHILVATGVLGLAPHGLWEGMPGYDSGLPYIERVAETVAWFFSRHRYEVVVVYSDFYAYAVNKGFDKIPEANRPAVRYVLGNHYRDTYENLLLPEHLHALEVEVRKW